MKKAQEDDSTLKKTKKLKMIPINWIELLLYFKNLLNINQNAATKINNYKIYTSGAAVI